jgi:hypothetical protein
MLGGLIGIALGLYFFGIPRHATVLVSQIILTLTVCYLLPSKLSVWKSRSSNDG